MMILGYEVPMLKLVRGSCIEQTISEIRLMPAVAALVCIMAALQQLDKQKVDAALVQQRWLLH